MTENLPTPKLTVLRRLGVVVGVLVAGFWSGLQANGCATTEPAIGYAVCVGRCTLDCLSELTPEEQARLRSDLAELAERKSWESPGVSERSGKGPGKVRGRSGETPGKRRGLTGDAGPSPDVPTEPAP